MRYRRFAAMAALLAIGVAVGRTAGSAPSEEQGADQDWAVRVAEAELKLAEMNLDQMRKMNERVPGTLIAALMQQFEDEVELAKGSLKVAQESPAGDPYRVAIERLELALSSAKVRAKRALDAHERAPTLVTRDDVERMRQVAIVTDLQLRRGKALENASFEEKMGWQVDVLSNQLDGVRRYALLLGQNRFGEFAPGM